MTSKAKTTTKQPAKVGRKQRRANAKKKSQTAPTVSKAMVAHKAHTKAACSILNPFCAAAKGSRRPDSAGAMAIPYQLRGTYAITTNADGDALVIVAPFGHKGYAVCTGGKASGTWTIPSWNDLPGAGLLGNAPAKQTRTISSGVIFRSTASMTNCQGLLHTFTSNQNDTSAGSIQYLSETNIEDSIRSMTSGLETSWIAKPLGDLAHQFTNYSAQTTTYAGPFPWTSVGFEIVGGPANTVVAVLEIVSNIEFTVLASATFGSLVPPPPPPNPVALRVQEKVHGTLGSIIEGGVSKVESVVTSKAADAVSSFFDSAMDFGLGLLGL